MHKKNEELLKLVLQIISYMDDHSALHDICNESVKRILEIRPKEENN